MSALDRLIEHWRIGPPAAPFIHARDLPFLKTRHIEFKSELAPYPYVGDLKQAPIWILMLNPSVADTDLHDEQQPYFSDLRAKNLSQDFEGVEYPFFALDPKLEGTGTYRYYNEQRGFARLIDSVATRRRIVPSVARRMVAQNVAVLELLPYRSTGFPSGAAQLPSVNLARAAAGEAVGNRTLIIPWKATEWRLDKINRPDVLKGSNRSFSFTPGGKSGFAESLIAALPKDESR